MGASKGMKDWPGPGQHTQPDTLNAPGKGYAFGKGQRSQIGSSNNLAPGPGNYNHTADVTKSTAPQFSIKGGKI